MGKFKKFLINEVGLGDLGQRIDGLMNSKRFGNQIGGAFVSPDVTGSGPTMGNLNLPSADLTVPSAERTGRITSLLLKKNPIYVRLSDGTEANFSYEEYRRIEGKPELGKTMTLIFQRHPEDQSSGYSKVDKAIVRD